ncbi:deoxyribonuclease IV [Selenomonas sp. TAMA-11512]|uniref:deoxyribonuclease IV n=1 Tax=Selenomonas sp. TAMA-11512 TaxID=3095337 RepID=UPI00308B2C21|nr:deoxyribonuclease IV [Selenomonas sp. TAMA-11512]
MGKEIVSLGGSSFAFFTRNPRGGRAKDIDPADIAAFLAYREEHGITHLVAHAPYTMNACAAKDSLRTFAREMMADDLVRLEHTPHSLYNFHPGSHVGQGAEKGIELITEQLNAVLKEDGTTVVLLETMAGKGSEVGRTFEELRAILGGVALSDKMGVCLDTCHVWDAGYDIVHDLDGVLTAFDRILGLSRLKAVHLNDSLNPLGSRKDRHARIGEGEIGFDALVRVINHPALKDLPFILETPNDHDGYAREIAMLQEAYRE